MLPGVYRAVKKDGTVYFRASITYRNKHISLGSFADEETAHRAYLVAGELLDGRFNSDGNSVNEDIDEYEEGMPLSFKKWVSLVNFRDNGIYVKTPIYLKERFFYYYFEPEDYLTFDSDDLFYYSTHSIMRRGGHYFVADFGMQVNIRSRYGIRNFAVPGRDYEFINGDETDFRSANIRIINSYHGVQKKEQGARTFYETRIHVRGDILVGRYRDEITAAIAYNKAADMLRKKGVKKDFPENYIESLRSEEYHRIYDGIRITGRMSI